MYQLMPPRATEPYTVNGKTIVVIMTLAILTIVSFAAWLVLTAIDAGKKGKEIVHKSAHGAASLDELNFDRSGVFGCEPQTPDPYPG